MLFFYIRRGLLIICVLSICCGLLCVVLSICCLLICYGGEPAICCVLSIYYLFIAFLSSIYYLAII